MDSWAYSPSGLLLLPAADRRRRYDRPVGIDLFAGAGGFSLGMHQAGVHIAAAVEFNPHAALTYLVNLARPGVQIHYDTDENETRFAKLVERHLGLNTKQAALTPGGSLAGDGWISNHPGEPGCEHFYLADVRNLTGAQILNDLGLDVGDVDIICGGPPCQGFSNAGMRQIMDPRNSLIFEFARLVLETRPKTFAMENVPGLLSMVTPEGVPVIDAFCRVLDDGGFGSFNALKAGLEMQAGNGGGVRQDTKPTRRSRKAKAAPEPGPEDADAAMQLDLFGGEL